MRHSTKLTTILTLTLALATAAQAQQTWCSGSCGVTSKIYRDGNTWVQEINGYTSTSKTVRVNSELGAVQVRGAEDNKNVTYVIKKRLHKTVSEELAKRELELFNVEVRRSSDAVTFEGAFNRGRSGRISIEYLLNVPKDLWWVYVNTMGGTVGINNVNGKVTAQTAGGGVQLNDISGPVVVYTMGGSVDVGNVGADAKLETAGGGMTIGSVGGKLYAVTQGGSITVGKVKYGATLETQGGGIAVKECGGDLKAITEGGALEIGDIGGQVYLESAGGGIKLMSSRGPVRASTASGGMKLLKLLRGVHAETANGPIVAEFVGSRRDFTDSHLETTAGDITVWLPSDLAVTVKAAIEYANGHEIKSELPGMKVTMDGGPWGPKQAYGEANFNGGGQVLKVHTSNGSIIFRIAKKQQ